MLYADLILPLPLPGVFTYSVPGQLEAEVMPGKRVLVPFGKKKIYSAIVDRVHGEQPDGYETKDILSVLDSSAIVLPVQLLFWKWIATYYMCTPGEVLRAALPAGLRLESETRLAANPQFTARELLNDKEISLLQQVENKPMSTISELTAPAGQSLYPVVRNLLDRNALITRESVKDPFKPKTEAFISLMPSACSEKTLNEITGKLSRAPRQLEMLYHYLHITGYHDFSNPPPEISRGRLLDAPGFSHAILKSLIKKGVLKETIHNISRIDGPDSEQGSISSLNLFQNEALNRIKEQFRTKDVVLLDGVTSAGKTEIYIHLIKEELQQGRQVLYLLPEIALTAQIIVRLKNIFGKKAGVYHSKFSDPERVEIWNNILKNDDDGYGLILGVRSSLFLPFSNLGLVIVDEEHENTFKQFDPSPRYHARDAAIMLASMHRAKTLLGTATPSVESAYNTLSGKYGLVNLVKRYREIEPPEIIIADTRRARKRKKMKSIFTPELFEATEQALNNKEQIILFQNRRGYATFMECADCGWIPVCRHCDVSMTYHKSRQQMVCHYCSTAGQLPAECPECDSTAIKARGFGTEKIEDEIGLYFPEARAGRLDLDSVRKKRAHEKIIGDFESGNLDILVGTQMIAKGLDFDRVSLVGILNADNLLFFPDFRAHERSFQLISQVSGRAGRKTRRGRVVIQTGFPGHPVIKHITGNDAARHYREQLAERKQFLYPPYVRLIRITIKDKNRDLLEKAASVLGENLREKFGSRVLGPEFPLIGRIQNRYIMNILLKIEKGANLPRARSLILAEIARLQSVQAFRSCHVYPDVDPF